MTLKPTPRDAKVMEDEIDHAVCNVDITTQNYMKYVEIIVNGSEATWIPKICRVCGKPPLLHSGGESDNCQATVKLLKGWQSEYKVLMQANKTIKLEVEEVIAKLHLTSSQKSSKVEGKFPLWDPTWSWEDYKADIEIFDKGSTKKPITKLQDMIAALKESKKSAIAQRITDTFKTRCEEHDIIKDILTWMSNNYGKQHRSS